MSSKKCRICNYKLRKIIDLGKIALVGEFKSYKTKLKKYRINLCFCIKCKHIQISNILNPNLLFKNYLWETGISISNLKLIQEIIKKLKTYGINKKSKIFEIACNDGSFLNLLNKNIGCFAVGIDPAENLLNKNQSKNIVRIADYFDKKKSKDILKKYGKFDFIFARNVIAHVKEPNSLFSGASKILHEKGIFIIEAPSLLNIIKFNQYDNIFHEHIGFHSLKSVIDLAKLNGLDVIRVENIDSQGGSLRYFLSKNKNKFKTNKSVSIQLAKEKKLKLFDDKKILGFKSKINFHRKKLLNFLNKLKRQGKNISIYGASGKGQALMQYCGINDKIIDYVFDMSRLKQNKFTPGSNIKILSPNHISRLKINYLLLLTWNLKKEILLQQKKFIKKGGKFIIPFSQPRIL